MSARRNSSTSAPEKSREHHRNAHHLLLEETDSQRAFEDRFEPFIQVRDGLQLRPPRQVRVHQTAFDGAGPHHGDFHHDIVKAARLQPGERGHLRAALDLKDADGVAAAHRFEGRRVVLWQVRQINRSAACAANFQRVLDDRHHAEAQQVHLHDAQLLAIVLVPLDDGAAGHRGVFQRHHRIQSILTKHHAPGVLPQVARQSVDSLKKLQARRCPGVRLVEARLFELFLQFDAVRKVARMEQTRKAVQHVGGQIERLADLAHGALAPQGDDVSRHADAVATAAPVHFLDDLFPALAARQVQVDVGPRFAAAARPTVFVQESLEQQLGRDGIDCRDLQAIANRRVGGTSPALDEDAVGRAKAHDVPDHQEISLEPEFHDEL